MLKTKHEITEIFLKAYSGTVYKRVLLTSEYYLCPTLQEAGGAIERNSVVNIKQKKHITECEKSAWYLSNAIHLERSMLANEGGLSKEELYTWAFGWCIGILRNRFQTESHTMCWAVTSDEGLKIIEPASNMIHDVDIKTYSVFWVVG